jgi:uncharacterized protein YkwD
VSKVFAAVVLVLAAGCAARSHGSTTPPVATAAAPSYVTAAHGPAVSGELGAESVHSLVQAAARAVGDGLVGDARLAKLAEREAVDSWDTEQLGLIEVAPELHRFSAGSLEALAAVLREQLPALLTGAGFTHYGAHLSLAGSGPSLSLVLTRRPLRMQPVPRRVELGARLRLRGVLVGYRDAQVVQRVPGTERATFTAGTGEGFDVQLRIDRPGAHEVELIGNGPQGQQLLARLRLHADVEPAPESRRAAAPVAGVARLRSDLLADVNRERAGLGLRVLQAHGVLDALCTRHALDWLDTRRQGHPLQQVRGAAARARDVGLAGGLAQELVVQTEAAAGLGRALLADATARASLLSPEATHLGLGLVHDPDGAQWTVAGLVVQLGERLDVARAPQQLLALLNETRRARGAAALEPDAQLAAVAARHADAFFAPPLPTQDQTVAATNASLDRVALRYRRTEAVMALAASLGEAAALEPALDAEVQAIGIGVAQGDRPDTGPRSVAVVLVLGRLR